MSKNKTKTEIEKTAIYDWKNYNGTEAEDFKNGANWQKEQDDVILGELILASEGASNFLQETGTVGSFLIDAIEKAKIHLKKEFDSNQK